MAKKPTPSAITPYLDTSYLSMQRDLFSSGTAAEIGASAFMLWSAIKHHADYETGVCWPSVRTLMKLTGLASHTVQDAINRLQAAHMLRVDKSGRTNRYIARDRMDLRMGDLLICTVVVDYCPGKLKDVLPRVKAALEGHIDGTESAEALALVELIPGPGFSLDAVTGTHKMSVPQSKITQTSLDPGRLDERLKELRDATK